MADAERTCAAAAAFAAAPHSNHAAFGASAEQNPTLDHALDPTLEQDAVLSQQLSGDMDDGMEAETFGGPSPDGGSLLEAPARHVGYAPPPHGGLPAAAAQLAVEKAALKRQLRQLDADFEVR